MWQPAEYKQNVVPHGDIDQQDTQYAVVKFADMSEAMQLHAVDCVAFAFT